ncbi:MAG: magnesium chelatase [Calditrichaeota bacterium]|nr:magnesium chelatase [Calditrichota bacterium]
MKPDIKTVGDLKRSGWKSKSVKEEMRDNLVHFLKDKKSFAPHILGYQDTVFPQIHHAILAKHDFILLGLRGQGKSKLLKSLVALLDEYIPYISGSLIHEDPFMPLLSKSIERVEMEGDELPIDWLHRSQRFSEKLATPDVSMADLIGDIDPIKAANQGLNLDNPEILDFGLVPKANRCIFAINELADLQSRIQVGLFNIMEEKQIQIKGFPIQFKLDTVLVYSANPEDYTARGSIITPLKDRIDSQIITHYPINRKLGIDIVKQEMDAALKAKYSALIPDYIFEIVEQIAIEARKSEYIDQSSGVSARLSISSIENIICSAESRSIRNNEEFNIRISDLYAAIPSITGKVELLYEGEQEGSQKISEGLIGLAIQRVFNEYFTPEDEKGDLNKDYQDIKDWFSDKKISIDDQFNNAEYCKELEQIKALQKIAKQVFSKLTPIQLASVMHLVLEGLVMTNHLSKFKTRGINSYTDMMDSFFKDVIGKSS